MRGEHPRAGLRWLGAAALICLACAAEDESGSGPTLSGQLQPFTPGVSSTTSLPPGALDYARALLRPRQTQALLNIGAAPAPADFVVSRVIVALREGIPTLPGYTLEPGPSVAPGVMALEVRRRGRPVDALETRQVLAMLQPHVRYAHLDFFKRSHRVPEDPEYPFQWHYQQVGMPAAWDLSTGASEVVCAVIDDGVNPHPDLDRLLPGYDLISDPVFSGDGDGRDAEPSQVPRSHAGQSVWHGVHVAGTLGASPNARGGVGVDWSCRILPVRVLGVVVPGSGQGTSADLAAGIRWAAGLEVPGVPANPNPAQIINLSLGGGPKVEVEQEAIDAAREAGATIIVAAGNQGRDASELSLAGYEGVIAVGATDYTADRAPYSNYGEAVDLMAPGGRTSVDVNADGYPDGVLSTWFDAEGREPRTGFLEGTSMAAPHVAGVAALMKAVRPALTADEIELILKETADPGAQCEQGCGAGLLNAAAALRRAGAGTDPEAPPQLSLSADRLNLGSRDGGRLVLYNTGGQALSYRAALSGERASALRLDRSEGRVEGGGAASLRIAIGRRGLEPGVHRASLGIESDGGAAEIAIIFSVGEVAVADVGEVAVGAFRSDGGALQIGGETRTDASQGYRFSLRAKPGEWVVVAVADSDRDGVLGPGDLLGFWRRADAMEAVFVVRQDIADLNFSLVPVPGEVRAAPCAALRRCWEGCGVDQACVRDCPLSAACEGCFGAEVTPCLERSGCPGGACTCQACPAEVDACFGPRSCSTTAPPQMRPPEVEVDASVPPPQGSGEVGEACGECQAPYACDRTVSGGICTRECSEDFVCPGGVCAWLDPERTGPARCYARCVDGQCPRPDDRCAFIEGQGLCLP